MTRMERRRQRQNRRKMILGGALAIAVLWLAMIGYAMTAKAEEGDTLDLTVVSTSVTLPEPVIEEAEIVIEEPVSVIEEPENVPEVDIWEPEGFCNEKTCEALLEQGYLNDSVPLDYTLQDLARTYCEWYGVPYHIALGVIQAESSFRADAQNGHCYGYMQVNEVNRYDLSVAFDIPYDEFELPDPVHNLRSGIYMLGNLYEKYGDWHSALMCYNAGEGGAYKHYFSQGITSTAYSRTVMKYSEEWKAVVG